MRAPAIVDVIEAVDLAAHGQPGLQLGDARIRVVGVGQNEELEMLELAGAREDALAVAR